MVQNGYYYNMGYHTEHITVALVLLKTLFSMLSCYKIISNVFLISVKSGDYCQDGATILNCHSRKLELLW